MNNGKSTLEPASENISSSSDPSLINPVFDTIAICATFFLSTNYVISLFVGYL